MPGGSQTRQIFWGMKIYYSGGWHDFGSIPPVVSVNTQPAYFGQTHNTPTVGEIWDKACSS